MSIMQRKKRVSIIGTVGVPACYGGFETLAEKLLVHLQDDYDMTVYCSATRYPKAERRRHFGKARLRYMPFDANGIQSLVYDPLCILHALMRSDVLLILGVSGAFLLPFVRLFTRKRIIVSIDGIEWKRGKWNKLARWYLWYAERLAVKYSHADISDNESIQDYTALRYNTLSRVIEYGADHTLRPEVTVADHKRYPFLARPYAFKVARIEPENNVDVVLEAYSTLADRQLVVVGNWSNSDFGRCVKRRYSAHGHLTLLDPIYDQRELDLLRANCALYIHGHSAGGTNPSLVEAMYLARPIIAYKVSYNRTTTEGKACYFSSAGELKHAVETTATAQWNSMGSEMHGIAVRRYTWRSIAAKYRDLIDRVVENEKPQVRNTITAETERVHHELELSHLSHIVSFHDKR
jgi:glycosyltransferase involved in cell wall biosynthesis